MELNSNMILKKVIKNNKFIKYELINFLNIDIEHCYPILNKRYNAKTDKNNLFIFITKDFKILGFLLGSKILSEANYNFSITKYNIAKNRKNMLVYSKYILMITPEMRIYKNIKNNYYEENIDYPSQLQIRLKSYKLNKYTDDDIKNMIEKTLYNFSKNMYNKNFLKSPLLTYLFYYDTSIEEKLLTFSNIILKYNDCKKLIFYNDEKKLLKYKLDIIDIYNVSKREGI